MTCVARGRVPQLLILQSSAYFKRPCKTFSRVRSSENRSIDVVALKGRSRLRSRASVSNVVSATKHPSDGEDLLRPLLRATELLCVALAATTQLYQLWWSHSRRNESDAASTAMPRLLKTQTTADLRMSANHLPTTATVFAIIMALVANMMIRWRTTDRSGSCNGVQKNCIHRCLD